MGGQRPSYMLWLLLSGAGNQDPGPYSHRDSWHRPGLVLQAQVHRPQEDQDPCPGRGRCHDCHSRPPGPEHPDPKVESCTISFFSSLPSFSRTVC